MRRYPPRAWPGRPIPRAGEPRPAALPPGERTVGQLVAESIRIYGEHFVRCLALGVAPAVLAVVEHAHLAGARARARADALRARCSARRTSYACVARARAPAAAAAGSCSRGSSGWLVFIPVPFLVARRSSCPALAWLAAFGLVVPVLVVEELGAARGARACVAARAGRLRARARLARDARDRRPAHAGRARLHPARRRRRGARRRPFVLANVVISPLLFIGAALLYVDQAARVE